MGAWERFVSDGWLDEGIRHASAATIQPVVQTIAAQSQSHVVSWHRLAAIREVTLGESQKSLSDLEEEGAIWATGLRSAFPNLKLAYIYRAVTTTTAANSQAKTQYPNPNVTRLSFLPYNTCLSLNCMFVPPLLALHLLTHSTPPAGRR